MKIITETFRAQHLRIMSALCMSLLCSAPVLVGCGGGNDDTITAPTILTQPTSKAVDLGDSLTLSVVVGGSSSSYQWYKNTQAITGATSPSLTISSVTASDAGTYFVVAANSAGTVASDSITLTVSSGAGSNVVAK